MRWAVLSLFVAVAACSSSPSVGGSNAVRPSDEVESIALQHLKGKRAKLAEHAVNLTLDVAHTKFPPIPDDRYPAEDRPLDRAFAVDQVAFYERFNTNYAKPGGAGLTLETVECRYSHDVEFGQITPVFRITWTAKDASGKRIASKGVGFGERFNELGISEQRKRELTIKSAAIAYQEAVLRCVLDALKKQGQP